MCTAVQEWREELLAEGHAKGEAKLASLFNAMQADKAIADFAKAAADLEFRAKMYEKYGIE